MSELSPEARALLEAARQDGAPTEADRARVERALSQVLASPSAATTPKQAPKLPLSQASGSVASAALKAVVVAVLAAVGALSIAAFSSRESPRPPRPALRPPLVHVPQEAQGPSVLVPAPSAQPQVILQEKRPGFVPVPAAQAPRFRPVQGKAPVFAPLDLREPAPAAAPVPAAAPPSPSVSDSQLAEELQLMSQAQLKLRSGDATAALERLDEHARSYPRGALSEERAAARVQALCALGRIPEARAESVQFLADHPQSPYAAKIRASCGGSP